MRIFKMPNKYFKQTGLTLVELMIAMTISSILMLGISNIYSSSKQAYKINDEFSELQENARLAFRFLTQDIRMAGYIGCAWATGDNVDSTLNSSGDSDKDDFLNGFGTGLEGFDATGTEPGTSIDLANLTSGFNRTVLSNITGNHSGSDVLIVRHVDGAGIKISSNKESANFWVETKGVTSFYTNSDGKKCHSGIDLCAGDQLMVSDCSKGRIFEATGMSYNATKGIKINHAGSGAGAELGNTPSSWGGSSTDEDEWFAPGDSEILKLGAYAYYVATGSSGRPTLMRLNNLETVGQELVEGVENMQVLYGYDTDDDGIPNQYDVATLTSNTNIVSTRISLLMSTPGEIPRRNNDTKVYKMLSEDNATNVQVTPDPDRRIRKVFTTTIKLRNKGLVDE